jgi:hypothetical protein
VLKQTGRRWNRWKAERHARLMVLYERFDLKVLDPGFLNPASHEAYVI